MSVYPTEIIKQLFFSFLKILVDTFVTNGLFHEYNDKSIIIIPTLYCSNKPLKNALLELMDYSVDSISCNEIKMHQKQDT